MGHNNLTIISFVQRRNTNSILGQQRIPDFRVRNSDSPGFSQVPIPYPISCGTGLGSLGSSHVAGRGSMVIDSGDLWLQDGDRKSPPKLSTTPVFLKPALPPNQLENLAKNTDSPSLHQLRGFGPVASGCRQPCLLSLESFRTRKGQSVHVAIASSSPIPSSSQMILCSPLKDPFQGNHCKISSDDTEQRWGIITYQPCTSILPHIKCFPTH